MTSREIVGSVAARGGTELTVRDDRGTPRSDVPIRSRGVRRPRALRVATYSSRSGPVMPPAPSDANTTPTSLPAATWRRTVPPGPDDLVVHVRRDDEHPSRFDIDELRRAAGGTLAGRGRSSARIESRPRPSASEYAARLDPHRDAEFPNNVLEQAHLRSAPSHHASRSRRGPVPRTERVPLARPSTSS